MIECIDLGKSFGKVKAVENVSFKVDKGEIFGLLGPNGAGKSTTLRMMHGLFKPDHGAVYIDGLHVSENVLPVQKKLGILSDGGSLYGRLTARENIRYFGQLQGVDDSVLKNRVFLAENKFNTVFFQNFRIACFQEFKSIAQFS